MQLRICQLARHGGETGKAVTVSTCATSRGAWISHWPAVNLNMWSVAFWFLIPRYIFKQCRQQDDRARLQSLTFQLYLYMHLVLLTCRCISSQVRNFKMQSTAANLPGRVIGYVTPGDKAMQAVRRALAIFSHI